MRAAAACSTAAANDGLERGELLQRIGVTGAFGFLGANFVSALIDARAARAPGARGARGASDYGITAFASRTVSNPLFNARDVAVESLDILDSEDLRRKFAGLDRVVHFAGRVDYRARAKRSVWDIDVLGTKAVFEAALAAGVSKVLYVSSISALGAACTHGAGAVLRDEGSSPYGDPLWPGSFASSADALAAVDASAAGDYGFLRGVRVAYFDAKLAGWELAKRYSREKGLAIVTIFPGTAVGGGDLHYAISALVDNVWEGRLRLSFEGSTSFMDARDLATGAILALTRGRPGEGYVIAGRDEDNLSYVDFQDLVASLAAREGRRAKRHPAVPPKGLLLGLARAAELALPKGSFNPAFVLAGSVHNVCSSAKARSELGYDPSTSLEPAILECRRFSEATRLARRTPRSTPAPMGHKG